MEVATSTTSTSMTQDQSVPLKQVFNEYSAHLIFKCPQCIQSYIYTDITLMCEENQNRYIFLWTYEMLGGRAHFGIQRIGDNIERLLELRNRREDEAAAR